MCDNYHAVYDSADWLKAVPDSSTIKGVII